MAERQLFVLNVNDDEANRFMVTTALRRAGFEVVEAHDGHEALDVARRHPGLIVLDVNLPDIDGLEVCRRLKADPVTRTIPVLQTSATFISAERRVEGLDSGADAYLAQPIEPPELVATVRSLLRMQRVERELRDASEDWRRTFDAIADAVAVVDRNGFIVRGNVAMGWLAGSSPEQLEGESIERLHLGGGKTDVGQLVQRVVAQGQRTSSDLTVSGRWFRVVADPIMDADGSVGRVVLIIADLTDYRMLEADHRRRAEELAELDRRKDEFLGMLAHELRNPLNAIAAANSLMDRVGAQDPRNARLRNTVRRQTRHLARLVDDLLEVSRVTRGKMRLQREPTDLVSVLKAAVESMRPQLDAKGQRLQVDLPGTPLPMTADALRLEQVFANLLQNASKYSEPATMITLRCVRRTVGEREVGVVSVRDEGIGIPREMLTSVFDLFVQVDQSLARSLGGLGLGLTIARSLVHLHGGRISASSEGPGRGSELVVELPLSEVSVLAPARARDARPSRARAEKRLRILVIEDNDDARETLNAWLREFGHWVTTASDGFEGLDVARTVHLDVVLIDIGLPGLDGYQVAASLRAMGGSPRPRLIAVTGYGRPEDSARAREAGFDAHLVKPVEPEQLARLIHAQASHGDQRLTFGSP
ncbi:MAG: response regulator [Vicinamibacterales bacterium]